MLASLVIVFREAIEAGLIVGIVLAATRGVLRRGRWVRYGIASRHPGGLLVAAFAGELGALFNGSGQEVFNAAVLLAAVGMLTWHNAWMAGHGRELAREVRAVGAAVAGGERPLAALALVVGCGRAARGLRGGAVPLRHLRHWRHLGQRHAGGRACWASRWARRCRR